MRKLWVLSSLTFLLALLVLVGFLYAGEKQKTVKVKGHISGVLCAAHGMLCPNEPEHRKKAELMGVFTENKKFYYLANVPHRLLELNSLKEVEVQGEPLPKFSSLVVKTLKIEERTLFKDGYLIDPMGHEVLPGDAKEIEEEFYCLECAKAKGVKDMAEIIIPVGGMTCGDCEVNVEKAVQKLDGVKEVKADYKKGEIKVKFEKGGVSVEKIVETINKAGYKAVKP